jgi:outer membrane protein assembly factor BamB
MGKTSARASDGTAPVLRGGATWIQHAGAAVLTLLACAACGGAPAAFGTRYPDNRDSDIELMLQRIDAAPERPAGTIAVAITAPPTQLYAYDLASRRVLWQRRVEASSAPHVAGDAIVLQSGNSIAGFDLHRGEPLFRLERGAMTLRAADGQGKFAVIVIGEGQGTYAKSEVLAVRGDSVQWRRSVDKLVGAPAVVGTMVLVPWANQFLSALDAQSGEEFARVRVHDGVIAHAFSDAGQVYIGSFHGVTRVTSSIGSGTLKGAGYFALPDRELPGRPLLLRDVYAASSSAAPDSAQHRIALAWRPIALDHVRIGLQDGNLYLVFYRFVYALDPRDYTVRWVYVHDADIVGATAQADGLALADELGRFAFVGAMSGAALWKEESKLPSTVARLPRGGAGASDVAALNPQELPARLLAAAMDPDARLVPARILAVEQLARLPQADATANLIELCDTQRVAPPVRERACVKLKDRAIGAEHLLTALERHAGYLEGTTTPPVGALAKAAASLAEKRAVPLLVAHLKDPNTRSSDLPAVVAALGELGDPAAGEPLSDFFRIYHADPIDEHVVAALELVPEALVKLNGPVAMPVLEAVTYDGLGTYSVRQKARVALDGLAAQQEAAQKRDEAAQVEQEQQVAAETQTAADPEQSLPTHLTNDLISEALLPVRDQLRNCLGAAAKPTFQARIVLVLEDAQVRMVSVLPAELQGCVEPLVRAQTFPKTRSVKSEQISYTLKR